MDMGRGNDDSSPSHRKRRFIPRVPRRKSEPAAPIHEVGDDDGEEATNAKGVLRRFNANLQRGPKDQKKSTLSVAFGPGGDSSPTSSIRTDGKGSDDEQSLSTLRASAANEAGTDVTMEDTTDYKSLLTEKKEYRDCWDKNTNYPTTLPLRKPNSGDPEVLNEKEFGVDAEKEDDENTVNPALELGLLEENQKKLFLVQLPTLLPMVKRSASAKGKEKPGSSSSLENAGGSKKGCSLKELPGGYMGKMLVYKSGAVKLKLGDILYDVSPGTDRQFCEDVAAINARQEECCVLGEIRHRAVITPDVDSLLSVMKLD